MDIGFLITTYNRQQSCRRLVDSLWGLGDIVVLNDGCSYNINGCEQYFNEQHNGKAYYWQTVKRLFALRGVHKYYFMLPDDFLPAENMVERAIGVWRSIYDPQKICLNLYTDRLGMNCWTNFKIKDFGNCYQTQWVDMCFLCEEKFFNALDVQKVPHSISASRNSGSGVGAMISRQLNKKKFGLYQVKEGLVIPQEEHHHGQMRNNIETYDSSRHSHSTGKNKIFTRSPR